MTCNCWNRERTSAFSSTLNSLTLQVRHHVAVTSTSTVLPSAMSPGSASKLNACHSCPAEGCETEATADKLKTRGTMARPAVIHPDLRDAGAAARKTSRLERHRLDRLPIIGHRIERHICKHGDAHRRVLKTQERRDEPRRCSRQFETLKRSLRNRQLNPRFEYRVAVTVNRSPRRRMRHRRRARSDEPHRPPAECVYECSAQ